MVFKSVVGATCACLTVVSFNTNAALVSRLGGLAYYDTDADLTWLTDAAAGAGSIFDDGGIGAMQWWNAKDWAASLEVVGVTGWRLPTTLQPDASCEEQGVSSYGFNCTGSELGNMFYNVFEGVAQYSILANHNPATFDLFDNIESRVFWTETEEIPGGGSWEFRFHNGYQGASGRNSEYFAWAVHDGDVSTVPVPAAVWLFGSGLIGLIGLARHKSRN